MGDKAAGYAPKRIPEEPSMTGLEGILKKTSTLFELCILNFVDSEENTNQKQRSPHTW